MLVLSVLCTSVFGHGNMVYPPTWFDSSGRAAGVESYSTCINGGCMWFTNETGVEKITLDYHNDPELRTYRDNPFYTPPTPWMSPGSAKIFSPCGISGGNPLGCPVGDENSRGKSCPGGGSGFGPDAIKAYPSLRNVVTTKWKTGSVVEAGWGIVANHGGGYQYRLCKVPAEGVSGLTEECFKAGALEFATESGWIQWGNDTSKRDEFKAVRTNVGTSPKNSTWARNPVPACSGADGGAMSDHSNECKLTGGTQFDPPAPGVQGFGEYSFNGWQPAFAFHIVDKLQLPKLETGKYVLSMRWDCEQTAQVWNTCSDIEIVA